MCSSEISVPLIVLGMPGIIFFECGRRDIIAPSPDFDLILSVFFHGFKFVEPLQSSIVSLVEAPVLDHWDVMAIELLGSIVESLDCPREDRGIANVELISVLLQHLACLDCLLNA